MQSRIRYNRENGDNGKNITKYSSHENIDEVQFFSPENREEWKDFEGKKRDRKEYST